MLSLHTPVRSDYYSSQMGQEEYAVPVEVLLGSGDAGGALDASEDVGPREDSRQTSELAGEAVLGLPEQARSEPVGVERHVLRTDVTPQGGSFSGFVTHYGTSYHGLPMGGCSTGRRYDSGDATIAATPWNSASGRQFACGTVLRVSGYSGTIDVTIVDVCPGCSWSPTLDLSEAGIESVCFGAGSCRVDIAVVGLP